MNNTKNYIELNFSCVTLNTRSLRDSLKRKRIFQWLEEKNVQIACLQETFITDEIVRSVDRDWNGQIFHSVSTSSHSRGVSILFHKNFDFSLVNKHSDSFGRKLLLNIHINNETFTIVNLYLPNQLNEKCNFLKSTQKWINQYTLNEHNLMIFGDFNIAIEKIDRKSGNIDRSSKLLLGFMKYLKQTDIWRKNHPTDAQFTYINPGNFQNQGRIDYIMCVL